MILFRSLRPDNRLCIATSSAALQVGEHRVERLVGFGPAPPSTMTSGSSVGPTNVTPVRSSAASPLVSSRQRASGWCSRRCVAVAAATMSTSSAVAAQASILPGVGRARARLVGSTAAPALRVTLWLSDDADVRTVLQRLHNEVMATARSALDLPALPVAVRLEVEHSCPARRAA